MLHGPPLFSLLDNPELAIQAFFLCCNWARRAVGQETGLPDHLVGVQQKLLRHLETQFARYAQVDDKLVRGHLLDG